MGGWRRNVGLDCNTLRLQTELSGNVYLSEIGRTLGLEDERTL